MKMDTRYKSPAMRRRHRGGPMHDGSGMASGEGVGMGGPPQDGDASDSSQGDNTHQPTSAFLPPSFFGGTPPKEGQSYTITVNSVDPDSGEAECQMNGAEEQEPAPTREEAMDQRFPPEEES